MEVEGGHGGGLYRDIGGYCSEAFDQIMFVISMPVFILIPINKMSIGESERSITYCLCFLCSTLNISCHFASGGIFRESK